MREITKEKLITTKQVAETLGTSTKVVLANAKKCLPEKKIQNGKVTYWTELEVTKVIEQMKTSNPNQSTFTAAVKQVSTALSPALKLKQALELAQEAYEEEIANLKAQNIEVIEENGQLRLEISKLSSEKQTLQIELDESKEWYSVKRMEKLNPDREFKWSLLKKESTKLGKDVKKVFDQNYGEVNAYHISVWESLYFDTLNYE